MSLKHSPRAYLGKRRTSIKTAMSVENSTSPKRVHQSLIGPTYSQNNVTKIPDCEKVFLHMQMKQVNPKPVLSDPLSLPFDADDVDEKDIKPPPVHSVLKISQDKKSYTNTEWKRRFYEKLDRYFTSDNNSFYFRWTRERINHTMELVETFYKSSLPEQQELLKDSLYKAAVKFDILYERERKFLIKKCYTDTILKIPPIEEYFNILLEIHLATGHSNIKKMTKVLENANYWIPIKAIEIFNYFCKNCSKYKENLLDDPLFYTKKMEDKIKTSKDIFKNRGKFEVIDLQEMPDGEFKWILYYQDYKTKFSILRPLITNDVDEIALELLKIFLEIGCPLILDSLFCHNITKAVINKIENYWPGGSLLMGSGIKNKIGLSHSLEVLHIKKMVKKCKLNNSTNNWSVGIYFIQFQLNSEQQILKQAPFVVRVNRASEPKYTSELKTEEDLKAWLAVPRIYKDINDLDEFIDYSAKGSVTTSTTKIDTNVLKENKYKNYKDKHYFTQLEDSELNAQLNPVSDNERVISIDDHMETILIKNESTDEYKYLDPHEHLMSENLLELPDPYHTESAHGNTNMIGDVMETRKEKKEPEKHKQLHLLKHIISEKLHTPLNTHNNELASNTIGKTENGIIIENESGTIKESTLWEDMKKTNCQTDLNNQNNVSRSNNQNIVNVVNNKQEYEVEVLVHVEDKGMQLKRIKVLL